MMSYASMKLFALRENTIAMQEHTVPLIKLLYFMNTERASKRGIQKLFNRRKIRP
jgi:hypothetical protein